MMGEPKAAHDAANVARPSLDALAIQVHRTAAPIEREWRSLAEAAGASVYQSFDWLDSWLRTAAVAQAIAPALVSLHWQHRIVAILPLGMERLGPVRVARLLGGEHANIRMPLTDPAFEPETDDAAIDRLLRRIARAISGVDLFDFDALPINWQGKPVWLASHDEARPARLAVPTLRLDADFKMVLASHRGPKKAKKHRWQVNTLEPVGSYRFRRAASETEAEAMLAAFLAEKAAWFRRMGIADRFAEPGIADFFRSLIARRWQDGVAVIEIDAIEFDGELHAILGSGTTNGRLSGYFLSIRDDAWRRVSPGELLLYDLVAESCRQGIGTIDLGRGEERYKTAWLDGVERHVRLLVPVTIPGRLVASVIGMRDWLETTVGGNPRLWQMAKAIRRWRGRNMGPREDDG